MSDGVQRFRDALSGIELPALDFDSLRDSFARCEASRLALAASIATAMGANGVELQLFRILDAIDAARVAEEALLIVARIFAAAHDAALEAERSCRIILAQAMQESGAPAISSGRYTADPLDGMPRVQIESANLLPAEFWRHPEPEPDKAKLRGALLAGREVPGARLVTGPPSVRISAKESRE